MFNVFLTIILILTLQLQVGIVLPTDAFTIFTVHFISRIPKEHFFSLLLDLTLHLSSIEILDRKLLNVF